MCVNVTLCACVCVCACVRVSGVLGAVPWERSDPDTRRIEVLPPTEIEIEEERERGQGMERRKEIER